MTTTLERTHGVRPLDELDDLHGVMAPPQPHPLRVRLRTGTPAFAACGGATCELSSHCEGCDQCDPTTHVLRAHPRGLHESHTVSVRWCQDCADIVNAGQHDHFDTASLGQATILQRTSGSLYEGPVLLVRTPSGRVHETNRSENLVRARIAEQACVHCGRSLAHRRDYEPGQLCQRCDVEDDPTIDILDDGSTRGTMEGDANA